MHLGSAFPMEPCRAPASCIWAAHSKGLPLLSDWAGQFLAVHCVCPMLWLAAALPQMQLNVMSLQRC